MDNTFTKKEMEILDKVALDQYGCKFDELDDYEQDCVYCYAEENIF